ncbi:MAG: multiprotein-bridging factor 1 family protein [Xenococcaceae cyanobacterium]
MIIKNEVQYHNTEKWAQRFEQKVAQLEQDEKLKAENHQRWKIYRDSYQSEVDDLRGQMAEYERVRESDRPDAVEFKVTSLDDLAKILIHARIAAKLSQKELAERLGIAEERVKEYEAQEYQTASWFEVMEVCESLGLQMQQTSMKIDWEAYNQMTSAINYCNSVKKAH